MSNHTATVTWNRKNAPFTGGTYCRTQASRFGRLARDYARRPGLA
jgi:hypothetical protein